MARGILVGSLFLHVVILICCILVNLSRDAASAWLMQKSEIWDEFCIQGESVWLTNVAYTKAASERCEEKLADAKAVDALEFYCADDSPLPEMCSYVSAGRWMLVLSFISAFAAAVCSALANRSSTEDLYAKLWPIRGALAFTTTTLWFHIVLFSVMVGSPLFYQDHLSYLARNNPVDYKQLGCVFQSPFVGGIQGLLSPHHSEECVYPGPAVVFVAWSIVFGFMAWTMLFLLWLKLRRLDPSRLRAIHRYAWGGGGAQVDSTRNLLAENAHEEDEAPRAGHIHYSLHGALTRRLEHLLPPFQRRFVGVLVPLLSMGSGCLFVAWFYHGQQFVVRVLVHDVPNLAASSGADRGDWTHASGSEVLGVTLTDMTLQVFTFDPVTTLKTFWESGGRLLCVMSAIWIDFFPFIKIVGWTLMWFVPMSEVVRGRCLTWFDALGKYSLVTLFTLNITTVAFLFKSRLLIPLPVPGLHKGMAVDIEVQYVPGRGVDWFIISVLWTMLIGSAFVELHSSCRTWEEMRRHEALTREHAPSSDDERQNTPLTSIGGLMSEAARRARERLMGAMREDAPMSALSMAPVFETHVFSPKGRWIIYLALLFTLVVTIVGLTMPVISFRRYGFTGMVLVNAADRDVSFSLGDFAMHIARVGGPSQPMAFTFIMLFFGLLMPTWHVAGLFILWGVPFRTRSQALFFRLVEFLDNWSALDVFVFAVFIVWFGIEDISFKIVKEVVPGMTAAIDHAFPAFEAVYPIESHLLLGFWVLLVSSVARTVMSFVLMEMAAMSIAQRQARQDNFFPARLNGAASNPVLRPEELILFSPAQRYIGVSEVSSDYVYAGLPKILWHWGEKLGLIVRLPMMAPSPTTQA